MEKREEEKLEEGGTVTVFGVETSFEGVLRFKDTLHIRGRFKGTIEATGALVVEKGAEVETDRISVASLVVSGKVSGAIHALDKVEMLSGSVVQGDVVTSRLRIADGVLFEGRCSMTGLDGDVEIFARPTAEIKKELLAVPARA
jgi:cytoskeletal protein CcmA (bactofilin family)